MHLASEVACKLLQHSHFIFLHWVASTPVGPPSAFPELTSILKACDVLRALPMHGF